MSKPRRAPARKKSSFYQAWQHLNQGQKLILLYIALMFLIGLPLTIWSVQQTIQNRSKATPQTIQITATVPVTAHNTPVITAENNQPPRIQGPQELTLRLNQPVDIDYTITDPDWRRDDPPPRVSFNPQFELPDGLQHDCASFGNLTTCHLFGTPLTWRPPGQLILITATDPHQASTTLQATLNFTE